MKYSEQITEEKEKPKGVKHFLSQIKAEKSGVCTEESTKKQEIETSLMPQSSNPFVAVISFMESLTYSYEDGRILFKKHNEKHTCKLQFLLLNPSSHFSDVLKEARSIIVAGGTMKPISEFKNRLFINAGADPHKIVEFACDHIIPPENILPIIVTNGAQNEALLFNYENRMKMVSLVIYNNTSGKYQITTA